MRALKHLCVVVQCVNPLVTTQAREGIETAFAAAADALAAVTTQAHEGIETGGVQYISAFSVNAQ